MGICSYGSIEECAVNADDLVPPEFKIRFEKDRVIKGHDSNISCTCFLSDLDFSYLVTSTEQGIIRIFDPRNGTVVHSFEKAHEGSIFGLCERGKLLVSYGEDSTVCFWDVAEKKLESRFQVSNYPVRCVHFINENLFATGCDDGVIRMYDFKENMNEDVETKLEMKKEAGEKISCFVSVGNFLLSGGGKFDIFGRIYLWDVKQGKLLKDFRGAHKGNVNCLEYFDCPMAFKTKGCLVSGGQDNSLIFWEDAFHASKSPKVLLRVSLSPSIRDKREEIVCLTKFGKYHLLMSDISGEVYVWNCITRQLVLQSRINSKKQGKVKNMSWIVTDKVLAVTSGRFVKLLTVHTN